MTSFRGLRETKSTNNMTFTTHLSNISKLLWLIGVYFFGYVHPKPDKFEKATFCPDRPSVHTKPDKFENGVIVAKTD